MITQDQKRTLIALALGGAGILAGGKTWTGFWIGAILAGSYLVATHENKIYQSRITQQIR